MQSCETKKLQGCDCPLWAYGNLRGQYIRVPLGVRTLGAAEERIRELYDKGLPPKGTPPPAGGLHLVTSAGEPAGDVPLETAMEEFIKSKRRKGRRSRVLYQRTVSHFVRWAVVNGLTNLKQIEPSHMHAYFAKYDGTEGGKGWNSNTAQSYLVHLRVFFNYCMKSRHWIEIGHSPAADPDLNYKKSSTRLPFSDTEVARILAAIDQLEVKPQTRTDEVRTRARALILLMLNTGMRISDATFFERAYVDRNGNLKNWIIKTGKELKVKIALQPPVLEALNALPASGVYYFQEDRIDYEPARAALRGMGKDEKAFNELMPDYLIRIERATKLVLKVLRLAGLNGACHRFRDTFAINMLRQGVPILEVCDFLGHSDVKITYNHYVKWLPEQQAEIAQKSSLLSYFRLPIAG
jgi:site-specific recombinase XerD